MAATERAATTHHSPTATRVDSPPASAMAAATEPIPIVPAISGIRRRLRLRMSYQSSTAMRGAAIAKGIQNR